MIFYFSATGNSKYAAQKLQGSFGGEMINVAEAMKRQQFSYSAQQGENIFFVLPVYFWNLPEIAAEFLRRVDFTGEKSSVFALLTCGGSAGGADRVFRKAMSGKNCLVKAVYSIVMPDNCVVFFPTPAEDRQKAILQKSEQQLDKAISAISRGEGGKRSNPLTGLFSGIGGAVYDKMRRTGKFRVKDSCFGCGLCQTLCPENVIVMEEGRPVWDKQRCTWCMGCINRCPVQAIQFGTKTEQRGRYIHPILK